MQMSCVIIPTMVLILRTAMPETHDKTLCIHINYHTKVIFQHRPETKLGISHLRRPPLSICVCDITYSGVLQFDTTTFLPVFHQSD